MDSVKLISNVREEPYYCANFEDAILVLRSLRREQGRWITGVACFDGQFIDITPKDVEPRPEAEPPKGLTRLNALCMRLLGEKLQFPFVDSFNGDILIPANVKLTKRRLRRLIGLKPSDVRIGDGTSALASSPFLAEALSRAVAE
jgi:hypothetical protein